jgi:hypothetical protein
LSHCLPGWEHENVVELVNDLFTYHPRRFNFSQAGWDPYGDDESQGPFWIRPRSLMSSNKGKGGFKKNYIQIVGHTQVTSIIDSFEASKKSMGAKYYLIDALDGGGYMSYEDGVFTPIQISVS